MDTNVPVIALLIPVEIAAGGRGDIFPLAVQGALHAGRICYPYRGGAVLSPRDCKGSKGMFRIGII